MTVMEVVSVHSTAQQLIVITIAAFNLMSFKEAKKTQVIFAEFVILSFPFAVSDALRSFPCI